MTYYLTLQHSIIDKLRNIVFPQNDIFNENVKCNIMHRPLRAFANCRGITIQNFPANIRNEDTRHHDNMLETIKTVNKILTKQIPICNIFRIKVKNSTIPASAVRIFIPADMDLAENLKRINKTCIGFSKLRAEAQIYHKRTNNTINNNNNNNNKHDKDDNKDDEKDNNNIDKNDKNKDKNNNNNDKNNKDNDDNEEKTVELITNNDNSTNNNNKNKDNQNNPNDNPSIINVNGTPFISKIHIQLPNLITPKQNKPNKLSGFKRTLDIVMEDENDIININAQSNTKTFPNPKNTAQKNHSLRTGKKFKVNHNKSNDLHPIQLFPSPNTDQYNNNNFSNNINKNIDDLIDDNCL